MQDIKMMKRELKKWEERLEANESEHEACFQVLEAIRSCLDKIQHKMADRYEKQADELIHHTALWGSRIKEANKVLTNSEQGT